MKNAYESVSVIGLGYIGLPTAAMIASRGIPVVGVDVDRRAVDTINEGRIHIVEPELDGLVAAAVAKRRLRATTKPEAAEAFLIAVPTPFKDDHQPDLAYVESAARSIAPVLRRGNLVVLESTSPVGTTEQMVRWLAEARPDLRFPGPHVADPDVHVAYCPERVLPGRVVHELVHNDRVIGGMTPACARRATELYRVFVQGECVQTNAKTAEMCKLTENSFRDVNIAFANELSLICDHLGIDVWELIRLANRHPRVDVLQPGPGVGGHCIAVDPWFIVSSAPEQSRLIRTAREVNDHKPHVVVERVLEAAARFRSPRIACLGLSFKADIDDLRESPAVDIVRELATRRAGQLRVVEPHVESLPPALAGLDLSLCPLGDALGGADVVVLLVNHRAFHDVPATALAGKAVIDTRGIWRR